MERMNELWRAMGGPGQGPETNVRAVKARVRAALDADPEERSMYMKQKLRAALAVAALAAAITGSALAVGASWNVLTAFFEGNTAPAQAYVDNTARTVSDENYTLTVESMVADEAHIYAVVRVTALSDDAKVFIPDKHFMDMDTWWVRSAEMDAYVRENPEATRIPSDIPRLDGLGGGELPCSQEDTRRFSLHGRFRNGTPASVLFRLSYMDQSAVLELPVTPAPTVTVELGGTGLGVLDIDASEPKELTIRRVSLTPFTCTVETSPDSLLSAVPNLRFRMADGSVRTQAQMMKATSATAAEAVGAANNSFNYRFHQVQDLTDIVSVIAFDREYPLNGGPAKAVDHDPALDPFTIPLTDQLRARLTDKGPVPVPVRALTEGLGGTCRWDSVSGEITCTYRGVSVTLTPGSGVCAVDGAVQDLKDNIPRAQYITDDGSGGRWVTVAPWYIFERAWGIDGFVTRTYGEEVDNGDGSSSLLCDYHDWYVIP